MSLEALDPAILGPALLAGLLVVATHVPLGRQVLARGIIFIDLAVAQIAGLGVIVAGVMGWESALAVQLAAVGAALAGAGVLAWTERTWSGVQEALIGSAFVLAATAGVLLLSGNPHGAEHLKELLVGQILWVQPADLIPVAALYGVLLTAWFAVPRLRAGAGFYLLFSLNVTASVQLVGVYLVFASLILPALAVRGLGGRRGLVFGYVVGLLGYGLGLGVSALADLPAGAAIVWLLACVSLVVALLRRSGSAAAPQAGER